MLPGGCCGSGGRGTLLAALLLTLGRIGPWVLIGYRLRAKKTNARTLTRMKRVAYCDRHLEDVSVQSLSLARDTKVLHAFGREFRPLQKRIITASDSDRRTTSDCEPAFELAHRI